MAFRGRNLSEALNAERRSDVAHPASTCRWAVPALFLTPPFWWDAEDRPWACTREAVPRPLGNFDYALIVTTICFVDSPKAMMAEAHRVLRPHSTLIVGFIDRDSSLGQHYLANRSGSVFYREADFYSIADVTQLLHHARFIVRTWGQTLTRPLPDIKEAEPLRPGTGDGAFVVAVAEALR
jgi:SAM-dependent methyltransferase